MLTNSLLLCLRDLLPVFVLFCYIRGQFSPVLVSSDETLMLIVKIIFMSLLIFFFYENISEIDEGNGVEWLRISFLSSGFMFIAMGHYKATNRFGSLCVKLGVVLLSATHTSSFLLFFSIYASPTNLPDLLIGSTVGFAICLSFYTLFGFMLGELYDSRWRKVAYLAWPLFLAGQLAMSTNYLQQIGVELIGSESLYDLSETYIESSVYGHVLKALFGFDASPSILYISVFAFGFIVMTVLTALNATVKQEVRSQ